MSDAYMEVPKGTILDLQAKIDRLRKENDDLRAIVSAAKGMIGEQVYCDECKGLRWCAFHDAIRNMGDKA